MTGIRSAIYLLILVMNIDDVFGHGNFCDFGNLTDCSIWNYSSLLISSKNATWTQENEDKYLLLHCYTPSNHSPIMESVWIPKASSGCSVSFDLIVFDRNSLVSLEVIMEMPPARDRILWSSSDDKDLQDTPLWLRYHVFIGSMTDNFRIILEASCAVTSEFSAAVLGLDNLRFDQCFPGAIHNDRCSPEELLCQPSRKCLDSDALCDFADDCPDGSDELDICDSLPVGSRCDFEDSYCSWFTLWQSTQSQLDWSRVRADIVPKNQEFPGDHTSGLQTGYVVLLTIKNGPKPNIVSHFRSQVFNPMRANKSCKVRFYYWITSLSDANVLLTVNPLGQNQRALEIWRLRQRSTAKEQRRSWRRASVSIPDINYPFFLQLSAFSGSRNGYFALGNGEDFVGELNCLPSMTFADDISLNSGCFSSDALKKSASKAENSHAADLNFVVTACGKEGSSGPTANDCVYSPTIKIDVQNNGLYSWKVPLTAFYNITAFGASGAGQVSGSTQGRCPGYVASGIFKLLKNTFLYFVVGQSGQNSCKDSSSALTSNCSLVQAGGGGTTFVFKAANNMKGHLSEDLLLIANGGSGFTGSSSLECQSDCKLVDLSDKKGLGSAIRSFMSFLPTSSCENSGIISSRLGGFGLGALGCGTAIANNSDSPENIGDWSIGIKLDEALASVYWTGNFISGLVAVSIVCDCPVSCVLENATGEFQCPVKKLTIAPNNDMLDDADGKSLLQYYIAGVFFLSAVIGVSLCIYFGLRKNSAKCIHDETEFISCPTDPATGRSQSATQRTNQAESFEMNRLYEIHGVRKFQDLLEIPRKTIQLKKALGQGAFGVVYEGCLRLGTDTIAVAVKTLPHISTTLAEADFAAEALIASRFYHPNIVKFFGVCFQASPKFIVLELLAGGDVLTFLRSRRTAVDQPPAISVLELLEISADIAKGCQYLEQHHFIHRDLAARNCLLTSINRNRIAKIADFGMAKDVIKSEYYRKSTAMLLPIKWMAPESIQNGIYSSQSDVWSFGVFMWEVFSLGCSPFTEQTNDQVIEYTRNGGRLNMPSKYCPPPVFNLMTECWKKSPSNRISFSSISTVLLSMMGSSVVTAFPVPNDTDSPLPLTEIGNMIEQPELIEVEPTRSISQNSEKEESNLDSLSLLLPSALSLKNLY